MMRMMVEVAAEKKKKKQRLHWGGLEATIVAVQLSSEQNNHVLPQLWPLSSSSREKRWFLDPFEDTTTKSKCMIWTSSMYLATGPASYPTFIIQLCTVARVPSHSASPDPALHQCSNQQPNLERDPSKPQGHHYLLFFKSLLFSILSPQKMDTKGCGEQYQLCWFLKVLMQRGLWSTRRISLRRPGLHDLHWSSAKWDQNVMIEPSFLSCSAKRVLLV